MFNVSFLGHYDSKEWSFRWVYFLPASSPVGSVSKLFRNRTTEEVFYDHLEKRKNGLVEEDIAQNYSPAVVQLTCTGIYRGHEGVREGSKVLKQCLPEGDFEYYNTLVDGEMAFLEWRGSSDHKEVKEGADSFLIRDGWIIVQTIHYKVEPFDK